MRVLCLTAGNELIHHWNAYAGGPEGAQPPEIPIKGLIRSITLSGELPEAEAEVEKDRTAALAAAVGPGVKVHQSALWEYRQWINKFDSL